ncbi:MAG TPA: WecB/TagA/CpsF family glycosyltransferase [Solirubrobacteraceae bacterium]|nr:WecB/TagA/CpsF family glycosyltransferase [Solirubrobacteraceae bacterium]
MDSSATVSLDYAPHYEPRVARPRTVPLMGLDVAAISERDTIDYVLEGLHGRRGGWICPANLDVLRQWRASAQVRELVAAADLVVADGMPLVWAGEIQGSPLPERVAGSSLIVSLTAAAADAGASVFLLGGNPGTAEAAVAELSRLAPELRLAGTMCPPFGFDRDPAWLDRIERELRATRPDIVYVGLGFPKQERLIVELRDRLPYTWFLSCGVSFSFVAGEIRRAPAVMQRLGLEWLHRMVQEPTRLYRRYLLLGVPFLVQLMSSALVFRLRHAARGAS